MDHFEAHQHLLAEITVEWLQAEADIKQAEHVCEAVVTPSVFELRYAGRRVIEAITLINSGASPQAIEDVLRDAKLDCHRARHDAVDAAVARIAKKIESMTSTLGHETVVSFFPKLAELRTALQEVRHGIVGARGDIKARDAIYLGIETTGFPNLIGLYRNLQIVEADMVLAARSKRRRLFTEHTVALVAIIVAVVDMFLHVFDIHFRFGR